MADIECSRIVYIDHGTFIAKSDEYLPTTNRNAMVHSLIEAYGLLDHVKRVAPSLANVHQLTSFHSTDYIDLIQKANEEDHGIDDDEIEDAGLNYDCPVKKGLFDYCCRIAGGTLHAAKLLANGCCDVAIHWMGGWHHAQRSFAAGFCYVNDCVLGITELRKTFSKVLYIDIDVHHGDGVQDAFYGTDKILTLSIHRLEAGFYPGTGSLAECGNRNGKNFCVNIPFKEGLQDKNFCEVLNNTFDTIYKSFKPDAVMLQMGADALHGDPMQSFNLTQTSYIECVSKILKWKIPTLILGGGGYNQVNTARCWTAVTAEILNQTISHDIPEHEFFLDYGPGYELNISSPMKRDPHTHEYINNVTQAIIKRFDSENTYDVPQ